MNPPPLPGTTPPQLPQTSFAHQAARGSLLAPVLAILVGIASQSLSASSGPVPGMAHVITGAAAALLILAGFVLGIVGLCGMNKYGTRGILGRSIAGLLINGLLLAIFAFGLVAGLGNRLKSQQALREMRGTVQDFQDNARKTFNPKTGITNVDVSHINRLRDQLDNASRSATGDDVGISKAMSLYLERMEKAAKNYQSAATELRAANVLSLNALTDKSQITARREVVRKFLAANDNLENTVSNSVEMVRADMVRFNVAPAKAAETLAGFESGLNSRRPLVLEIRRCDDQSGQAMQDILSLLETNWGKWQYHPDTNEVFFDDQTAKASYRQSMDVIKRAGDEQLQAQQKLVDLQL